MFWCSGCMFSVVGMGGNAEGMVGEERGMKVSRKPRIEGLSW